VKKILVTGVGGGVGQSIVKSLQDSDYCVIGADGEASGTGLFAVAKSYRIPYANHPDYVRRIFEICKTENCALVFPGLDAELPVLAREAERFKSINTTLVVSSPDVIEIADDKLATVAFLNQNGFSAPLTFPLTAGVEKKLPLPMVLKPKKGGARSHGVFLVRDRQELVFRLATLDVENYVAQEFLPGDEYTCGTINFDGRCHGAIVLRRILRDGDTYKAFVENKPEIEACVKRAADLLKPFGACNFQLRMKRNNPCIFEINARCSGTTFCRTLAGFNEPLMIADFLIRGKNPSYSIREISIFRYWKELVIDNARLKSLAELGTLDGDGSRL
jgi:carbamoyl-phosphate synthase large subunit